MTRSQSFLGLSVAIALLFIVYLAPSSAKHIEWVQMILVLAVTMILPIGLNTFYGLSPKRILPGAWALGSSYLFIPGYLAGGLATLWLLTTCWIGYTCLISRRVGRSSWSRNAAFCFLPVGAAWAVADRLGLNPMAFKATIVLLTAVHFHYAGFLLLSIADRLLRTGRSTWYRWLDYSLVAGVPLVALGITLTELGGPPWIETLAATIMAGGGIGVAVLHLQLLRKAQDRIIIGVWLLGSLCLLVGMLLALAYAWRPFYPLSFLSIPWMYAVHGTLNALGVGVFLLLGWYRLEASNGSGNKFTSPLSKAT